MKNLKDAARLNTRHDHKGHTMKDEVIEAMARAMYEARFGNWRRNWKENWNDPDFDREDKAVTRVQATAAYNAIEAKGCSVVPIEPNEAQRQHVENLVSIFVADDDHLRFVTSDLIIRSYRAMCRVMIAAKEK
jgi:hypothetical protein